MDNFVDKISIKGTEHDIRDSSAVRTVNNATPDENGNVTVEAGVNSEELSTAIENALNEAKESGEFDGKSAYSYAQDGGYEGTEAEFAEKLAAANIEPLIGLSSEITPSQVAEAVKAGRDVVITHFDLTYGAFTFNAFMHTEGFRYVIASDIVYFQGSYMLIELGGFTATDKWTLQSTQLATTDDIPTALPNPNGLTIGEGIFAQTYDGSEAKDFTETINGMIDAKLAEIPNASGVSF
jgi:hypothetical protein